MLDELNYLSLGTFPKSKEWSSNSHYTLTNQVLKGNIKIYLLSTIPSNNPKQLCLSPLNVNSPTTAVIGSPRSCTPVRAFQIAIRGSSGAGDIVVVLSNKFLRKSAAAGGAVVGAKVASFTVVEVVGAGVVVGGGIVDVVVGIRDISMLRTLVTLAIDASTISIIWDIPLNLNIKCNKPPSN